MDVPLIQAFILVMLVWGVASEALRDIITGFLDQVRFD
jgi:ABC-type dipeptide/oligopeptide/nickel transport system permease component